jgi:hypothetical protein
LREIVELNGWEKLFPFHNHADDSLQHEFVEFVDNLFSATGLFVVEFHLGFIRCRVSFRVYVFSYFFLGFLFVCPLM